MMKGLILAWMILGAGGAFATDASLFKADAEQDTNINPFRKSYWSVEVGRNFPESFTRQDLSPGDFQPIFGYMHDLDANWLMDIKGQAKMMERRVFDDDPMPPPSKVLVLWTVTHTTYYVTRLSHPIYALIGPKLLYMMPALSGKFPPDRDASYDVEVGAGISAEVIRMLDERTMLILRCDRWRGTKTSRLMGTEVAFGMAKAWN